jgi:outer membrane protein
MARQFTLWVFLLWFNSGWCQHRTLGLEEAIKIGLDHATQTIVGSNQVTQAGAQLLYAYGAFLPNATFSGDYDYAVGNTMLTTTFAMATIDRSSYDYQLTSTLNIYSGGYNRANLKVALLGKKSAELSLLWARQQVAFDIIQTFLQVTLDKKNRDLLAENLDISVKREDQISELTKVGRLTQVDLFRQKAQTSQDKYSLTSAENKLRTDKIIFLNKLRLNIRDSLGIYDIQESELDSTASLDKYGSEPAMLETALTRRPDLKATRLNLESAEWNLKKYRSGYLPHINAELGGYNTGLYYNYLYYDQKVQTPQGQNSIAFQLTHQVYLQAGLNITWNLFDNFYTRSNVIAAKAQLSDSAVVYRDQQLQVIADIRTAYGNYKNDLQQISTATKGLESAQKAFDATSAKYTLGSSSYIDVINAQMVLLSSRQSLLASVVSLMMDKKMLDYLQTTTY